MNATQEQVATLALPQLAVPSAAQAISVVNRWLHGKIGTAVNTSQASFHFDTYCWHLPIQLAYPDTGPVGVIGDVYLHAATGQFIGRPDADDLKQRAVVMAEKYGLIEDADEDTEVASA